MGKTTRIDTYLTTAANLAGKRGRAKSARVTGIAILADELEWQALAEENPLFEFKDYRSYLVNVERRMRAAARAGRQVLVGPLMPDQFETRADAAGLPRDSPRALKEYERFVADLGPLTRPWTGEPITQVLENLRAHVRAETLQTRAMPALAAAAALHEQPDTAAQRAMSQAAHVFMAVANGSGDGRHEVRIRVSHPEGELEYTLPYTRCGKVIAFPDDGGEQMVVVLLAIASLAERPGSMIVRSRPQLAFFPPRRRPKGKDKPGSPTAAPSPPAHTDPAADPAATPSLTPAPAPAPTSPAAYGAPPPASAAPASAAAAPRTASSSSAADTAPEAATPPSAATHVPTPTPCSANLPTLTPPSTFSASSASPMPSTLESRESILRGWRLGGVLPQPMSEGQLFAYSCTAASGEPVPPERGTRFRAAFPLAPGSCQCCP